MEGILSVLLHPNHCQSNSEFCVDSFVKRSVGRKQKEILQSEVFFDKFQSEWGELRCTFSPELYKTFFHSDTVILLLLATQC